MGPHASQAGAQNAADLGLAFVRRQLVGMKRVGYAIAVIKHRGHETVCKLNLLSRRYRENPITQAFHALADRRGFLRDPAETCRCGKDS
ncbi:MAG: hypothetical protein EBT10_01535 [Methylocystaceae bacterium]|nr:hypothetical protein [Methylocystaceae bacterium]